MTQQIDVTNDGGLRVQQGETGTVIISTIYECLGEVLVSETEIPWLINTLAEIHRQLTADARRVEDAATLDEWNALASMMAG